MMKGPSSWLVPSFLLLMLVALTGACTSGSTNSDSYGGSQEAKASTGDDPVLSAASADLNVDRASPSQASSQRPLAADFSVNTGGDSTFSLSDHRGEVIVLYFSFPG